MQKTLINLKTEHAALLAVPHEEREPGTDERISELEKQIADIEGTEKPHARKLPSKKRKR